MCKKIVFRQVRLNIPTLTKIYADKMNHLLFQFTNFADLDKTNTIDSRWRKRYWGFVICRGNPRTTTRTTWTYKVSLVWIVVKVKNVQYDHGTIPTLSCQINTQCFTSLVKIHNHSRITRFEHVTSARDHDNPTGGWDAAATRQTVRFPRSVRTV